MYLHNISLKTNAFFLKDQIFLKRKEKKTFLKIKEVLLSLFSCTDNRKCYG